MILFAATEDAGDEPDRDEITEDGSAPEGAAEESNAKKLKRRAGTIWRVLTDPLVVLGLTVLVLIFGRGYLRKRAKRIRRQRDEQEENNDGA